MKIKEIRFDRTYNLGNFESIKIGLTADVNDSDCLEEVFNELKETVKSFKRQAKV